MGGDSSASNPRRQSSAELLVKGETQWRTVSAQFPVGPVREITGISMNNKVYFIGKKRKRDMCICKFCKYDICIKILSSSGSSLTSNVKSQR